MRSEYRDNSQLHLSPHNKNGVMRARSPIGRFTECEHNCRRDANDLPRFTNHRSELCLWLVRVALATPAIVPCFAQYCGTPAGEHATPFIQCDTAYYLILQTRASTSTAVWLADTGSDCILERDSCAIFNDF